MATTRKTARKAPKKKAARRTTAKTGAKAKSRAKAKAKTTGRASTKRGSGKRELIENAAGASYAKRAADGTFKEMDARRRALASDVRTRAKTKSRSGYGDRGDR